MAPVGAGSTALAAAKRLVVLIGGAIVLTAVVSAAFGAAIGSDVARSVSTGLYLVGSFLLLLGVFAGLRGPVRPRGGDAERQPMGALFGVGLFTSGVRNATAEERADARSTAWLFLGLGVALIVAAILFDPRSRLF